MSPNFRELRAFLRFGIGARRSPKRIPRLTRRSLGSSVHSVKSLVVATRDSRYSALEYSRNRSFRPTMSAAEDDRPTEMIRNFESPRTRLAIFAIPSFDRTPIHDSILVEPRIICLLALCLLCVAWTKRKEKKSIIPVARGGPSFVRPDRAVASASERIPWVLSPSLCLRLVSRTHRDREKKQAEEREKERREGELHLARYEMRSLPHSLINWSHAPRPGPHAPFAAPHSRPPLFILFFLPGPSTTPRTSRRLARLNPSP